MSYRHAAVMLAALALLIVYPIPNVIALRNALLMLALMASLPDLRQALSAVRNDAWAARALMMLVALYVWLIVVAVTLDPFPLNSLREFLGQWVTAFAVFFVGIAFASCAPTTSRFGRNVVALLIFTGCMFHVLGQDIGALWEGVQTRQFPFRVYPLTDHPANVGYVVMLLLPLLGADLVKRASGTGGLLPWKSFVTYSSALLICIALLTAGSRNSNVVFLIVVATIGGTLWWRARGDLSRTSRAQRILVLLIIAGIFAGVAYKLDSRWDRVAESVRLGWDTDSHLGWVYVDGRDIPRLSNGDPVEESAYMRTAFLKEGLRALWSHLLGTEINKNAFKNLITTKYGTAGMCCAHNGLVDLGISAGVPAIILWCVFLFCLYRTGSRCFDRDEGAIGYALMLLVIGFAIRMFFDSTVRDHIILQFMLCAGLLMGSCVKNLSQWSTGRNVTP